MIRKLALFILIGIHLSVQSAFGDAYSDIEALVLQGEYQKASEMVDALKSKKLQPPGFELTSDRFYSYFNTIPVVVASEKFSQDYEVFLSSAMTRTDFSILQGRYSNFIQLWNERLAIPFYGSKTYLAYYNGCLKNVQDKMTAGSALFNNAEKKRNDQIDADKKAALLVQQRQEEDRAAEEEQQRIQEEAALSAERTAIQKKVDKIDSESKKRKYKGLFRGYGIWDFLYACQQGKLSLRDGVDKVFWTETQSEGGRRDASWRLVQVVSGYEIYASQFSVGNLRIAIKAADNMQVEGQRLKNGVYALVGNQDFTSVLGANMTIPVFSLVPIVVD